MPHALGSRAAEAQECARTLERALASARSQWGDATRQAFDERHGDQIVSAGRKVADELNNLAQELASALASLHG